MSAPTRLPLVFALGLLVACHGSSGGDSTVPVFVGSVTISANDNAWVPHAAFVSLETDEPTRVERLAGHGQGVAQGFVSASLLYCVGAMAIVGSMESGLSGDHQTLFAKSILDGISSVLFASTLGIGVIFSAASVFLYQGLITLTASSLRQFLVPDVVSQMSAIGGLLILAIGIGLLEIKKIKVGNILPAIFIPLIYQVLKHFSSVI